MATSKFRKYTTSTGGSFNIPLTVFSQCTGAGIDIFVNFVTTIFSQEFKLSIQGSRNINNSLNNLPVFSTPDQYLTFGWSTEHALRNEGVGQHSGGYEHVALEGTLSDSFSEPYVALVLYHLSKFWALDDDVVPHYEDWRKFVRSSGGIFATSDFGLIVEKYVRLNPLSREASHRDPRFGYPPHPWQLAEALKLLAEVSQTSDKKMIVIGGSIIGWVAAFNDWLLGLPFSIYGANGQCLHPTANEQSSRVLFVYLDDSDTLGAEITTWEKDEDKAKTFGSRRLQGIPVFSQFCGRVTWNSLLTHVFGQSFTHLLHEESSPFAQALGCAANLEGSEGAFTRTLTTWFPELYRLQGRMEQQLKLSEEAATISYDEQIARFQKACNCGRCQVGMSFSAEATTGLIGKFCLPAVVETVVALGIHLTNVTVTPNLYPARGGIKNIYNRVFRCKVPTGTQRYLYQALSDLAANQTQRRLETCINIFSGARTHMEDGSERYDTLPGIVALSREGICAYLMMLERPNTPPDVIRVTSGRIGWRHKMFNQACMGNPNLGRPYDLEDVWEEITCSHLAQPIYCK